MAQAILLKLKWEILQVSRKTHLFSWIVIDPSTHKSFAINLFHLSHRLICGYCTWCTWLLAIQQAKKIQDSSFHWTCSPRNDKHYIQMMASSSSKTINSNKNSRNEIILDSPERYLCTFYIEIYSMFLKKAFHFFAHQERGSVKNLEDRLSLLNEASLFNMLCQDRPKVVSLMFWNYQVISLFPNELSFLLELLKRSELVDEGFYQSFQKH